MNLQLTEKEQLLIEVLRELDPEDRGEVIGMAEAFLLSKKETSSGEKSQLLEKYCTSLLLRRKRTSLIMSNTNQPCDLSSDKPLHFVGLLNNTHLSRLYIKKESPAFAGFSHKEGCYACI